jgi:hypothetical protein
MTVERAPVVIVGIAVAITPELAASIKREIERALGASASDVVVISQCSGVAVLPAGDDV